MDDWGNFSIKEEKSAALGRGLKKRKTIFAKTSAR